MDERKTSSLEELEARFFVQLDTLDPRLHRGRVRAALSPFRFRCSSWSSAFPSSGWTYLHLSYERPICVCNGTGEDPWAGYLVFVYDDNDGVATNGPVTALCQVPFLRRRDRRGE